MNFRAMQRISVQECGFEWSARLGPAGLVHVKDALLDGAGHLHVAAFGLIPIVRRTPELHLTRGELMRYLAELAWAPDALLLNPHLRWRIEGPDRIAVSTGEGEVSSEVMLTLNAEGRILSVFAPDRPRAVGKSFVPTPWRGCFSDYRSWGGYLLPFRASVAWLNGGQEVVCWEGEMTDWSALEH